MTLVLPDEVVYHIFSYLDPQSLGLALQCSTTFYRIATAPALWELPYLLRWSTGDPDRELQRGTGSWRQNDKSRRLREHARRAAAENSLSATGNGTPFSYLQLGSTSTNAESSSAATLDFYRLFLERIAIDQQVIEALYDQVEATHGRITIVTSLARRFGNDAKDVLTAVVEAQSSCPSYSPNGLLCKLSKGNASERDPLAYDSTSYRLTAYQAHLPTTLRSETHHLVILHHAREMLEHLQRREAMHKMTDMARSTGEAGNNSSASMSPESGSDDAQLDAIPSPTETAVSLLTMFRGGEITYVETQLDVLAAACDLYLQQRFSQLNLTEQSALEKAKDMAMAICDFLADHGFRGARDDLFSDLDNHFLHHCFTTNRETLPLSLTLIFCGVANRLGLRASLCNFPMRILAFVMADPTAPLPGPTDTLESASSRNMFWLDVCEYTTVAYDAHEPTPADAFARRASWLQQRPPILDRAEITDWIGRMGIPPSDDFWRPAQPSSMVQRAARNILSSVQRAQVMPRSAQPGAQARNAIRNIERNKRADRIQTQWSDLSRVDFAFLSSCHGRSDPIEHASITAHVSEALRSGKKASVVEDESVWGIVKKWRSESMLSVTNAPETWVHASVSPAERLRMWMEELAHTHDWTRTKLNLNRRADHWSEHEQQAAKYAAVNAFLRLSTQVNAREVDWIAGFLQINFMLDVEVIEKDFLGVVHSEGADEAMEEDGNSSEGSDSSHEASFSSRVRNGDAVEGAGIVTNASARVVLRRMLQAVRAKDAEAPRVNKRTGAEAKRQRQVRAGKVSSEATTEEGEGDEEEDHIGYRVGTIFRHRTYRYAGCVLGWDPYCAAPEDWIVNMGVDRLPAPASQPSPSRKSTSSATSSSSSSSEPAAAAVPPRQRRGGRHQPFYHSQVADGTRRYVAEVNVEPITGPIWIYGAPASKAGKARETAEQVIEEGRALGASMHKLLALRGLGEYFRCFDQEKGRLRRNRDARTMFPDDWSDDEDADDLNDA